MHCYSVEKQSEIKTITIEKQGIFKYRYVLSKVVVFDDDLGFRDDDITYMVVKSGVLFEINLLEDERRFFRSRNSAQNYIRTERKKLNFPGVCIRRFE